MTVVIIGTMNIPWVAELAAQIQRRGFAVLALENMSLVAYMLLSGRVAAVVVHEDRAPANWELARHPLAQMCPTAKIVFVRRDDPRTLEALASDTVEEPS